MLGTYFIKQWGFFSVPQLLWHGTFVYNGHLRGPVTLTRIAERLAVDLSLPVFTTWVCCGWDSNSCNNVSLLYFAFGYLPELETATLTQLGFEHPTLCLRGERSIPLRHRWGNDWRGIENQSFDCCVGIYIKRVRQLHQVIYNQFLHPS